MRLALHELPELLILVVQSVDLELDVSQFGLEAGVHEAFEHLHHLLLTLHQVHLLPLLLLLVP